jgi:hypothetical protein
MNQLRFRGVDTPIAVFDEPVAIVNIIERNGEYLLIEPTHLEEQAARSQHTRGSHCSIVSTDFSGGEVPGIAFRQIAKCESQGTLVEAM